MSTSSNNGILVKFYDLLILLTSNLQSLFILALRVVWGWQFFQTGKGKLENLDKVTEFFNSLHIPAPKFNAALAGGTECFGGLMLLAGLGGRLASVPLTITMIVAYLTAERPNIHNLDDFVKADPFPFLMTSLIVMIFGPGRISVDYLIKRFALNRPDSTLS